jgi:chromosome segregation ATPase
MLISETEQKEASSENYLERFERERKEWTSQIKDIAARFKKVEDLVEVQVDLYSQRQVAVDYMQQLNSLQARIKKGWLTEWKKIFDNLSNVDIRYSEKERTKLADEKTGTTKLKIDIMQVHIEYFKETIKTLDNMIFGVKHRIEIEDFRRGNK